MDLIFFNTPGSAKLSFGNPVFKRIWLSEMADMTTVIVEVLSDVSNEVTRICIEDCLKVRSEKFTMPCHFFSGRALKKSKRLKRIAFFAASDTLSFLLSPVIQQFKAEASDVEIRVWHRNQQYERGKEGFESNSISSAAISLFALLKFRPQLLVLGNDWTADAQFMIALGRWIGMRSVCLQESVIDLADPVRGRLRWADFALLQGAVVPKQLPERKLTFLTGNPRYEQLEFQKTGNKRPFFLLNCNFTYGVHEEQRLSWLDPIVELLEAQSLDYVIAQHPRDTGNLVGYRNVVRTNASVIHELIRRSDCIISRFSSLLHEGLFLGKRAIYFNPHGESVGYDYRFDGNALFYAPDKIALEQALNVMLKTLDTGPEIIRMYLEKNCHYGLGKPSEIISGLLPYLVNIKADGKKLSVLRTLWDTLKFYYFPKKKRL